jgi:hypothetical protein
MFKEQSPVQTSSRTPPALATVHNVYFHNKNVTQAGVGGTDG